MQKINRGNSSNRFDHFSPLRLFTIIIASIFIAEVIAMVVVSYIDALPYYLVTLVDAGIMVILIFPILYWFSFRPLIQHIEELRSAEKSLQLLSSVVEQTADTVVVTNCDGVIEYVNPAFEQLTGYSKEEALGETPRVLKSGIHDEQFYKRLWQTVLDGQVFHRELTNRKKNGDIFHEVKTITPLRNKQGEITHFVATGKDITERKEAEEKLRRAYDDLEIRVQNRTEELRIANSELEDEIRVRLEAERALQQSEERLKRAQEIAHLGSWELDLLTDQLTWSDEVYRIFGLQPQEFGTTYEAFLEAVHPDDRVSVDDAYSGSIRDGRDSYEIEHRVIKHSTGEIRIVHEKGEHFRNEAGEIIRSVGMVHDITERKHAEEQLRYQATLLSNVNDAIVASDVNYQLTAWNSAAESLYGWSAEEVLGRNGLDIVHTEWPEREASEMRRRIAETGRWRGEATQQRKDGSRFPVEVSSIVLQDANGRITGFVSVNRDITERKKAEENLQRFQLLSQHSRDVILFMRFQDGQVLDVNAAAIEVYGYGRAELLSLKIQDLRADNALKLTAEQMAQANERGILFETVHRRKDGSSFPVEVSSQGATIGGVRTLISIVRDITERKKAEEQLARINQKLNEILSSIQDDFYVLDRNWNFIYANKLFTSKIGKAPEDFIGNNIWEMFPKHVGTILEENFRATMEKREVRRFELGGKYTSAWYRMTAFPSAEGVTVIGVDITERKKAEAALRLSEENFSKAFKSSPAALIITRLADGKFMELNDAYSEIVGFERSELIGHCTTEFNIYIHTGDRQAIVSKLLETGSVRNLELDIRNRSGAIRHVAAAQELISFNGESCILTSLVDVTERKQAEQALQKSEAMLRAVLENMPSGVTVRDAITGELIVSNAHSREILGTLVDTTDQLSEYHGLHPDGRFYQSEEWPLFRSITTGEQIDSEEIELERSSGINNIISVSSAPIYGGQGQIIGGVSVFQDITERKKAERELQQLNHTLQALSASNQAMMRASNETELLDEVCKIIVEDCGHAMVWIGYAENDEEKSVRPVASAGFEEGYLETLNITWADTERGRGPTGVTIRTGKPHGCRNMLTDPQFAPWREQALKRGYASSMVLPLTAEGQTFGAMTIYARKPDAFSADEEKLLLELARDLAHGIETIRLREAHEKVTLALRESEERFRLALTHAPVTVAVQDCGLRYTWAYNQRTRNVEEIIGKTDFDLFPLEADRLTALKQRVIETGENVSEQFWITSNNQRVYLDLFIEPLKNQNGEIEGVGLATVDLTAIKLAEEALRESETKYRNLFENMTEEVHFWKLVRDEAGCIKTWRLVDANPPAVKSWGRDTTDEIRGKTTEEIFGPGATDHYMSIVQKIMTEGVSYSYEDYFPNLDKYFRFTSVPFGEYFITTGADITIIKKAEQALRRAHDELEIRVQERTEQLAAANEHLSNEIAERKEVERQLRIQTAAMDAAANGIIITDPKGSILWANPAVTQISGYSETDLIGQSTRIFSSGKQDADFYHEMWETILAGNVWHGETINSRKDGGYYVEEQTITPVRDESGQISHFIAVKQDITERKLIYSQLEDSNRDLKMLTISERQQRFLAEGLVESSIALNMSLELHAVLDHIFEQTRRTIPYLMADIVLIEDGAANVVRQWGIVADADTKTISENNSLKLGDFPIWERICATKSPLMIANTTLENQWNTYLSMPWIQSYLGAPLIYNDQVIGIIDLIGDQANAFHEDMAKTLMAFAAPAAVAIQNARLYENEQQNRKVAEILSAATVALAQTLDIQMVMETILDYVQFVMPFGIAFVILSEGEERYRIRAVRAGDGDHSCQEALQDQTIDMLNEPIVRSYFAKYESTFIPDSREILGWHPPLELSSLNCWLGIPLVSMGKILGMVVIGHPTPHFFTKNQTQLAEAVVKQAVVALQNAWLFEQVRSGRERLQQLSRHLVDIQENERKYIARELHDETSQSLTSLKLGLQVIEQKAAGHEQLLAQVENLKALADETLESLHHLAVNLRPASLDHLGLVEALTSLIQSTRERFRLTAHFKTIGSAQDEPLTEEIESSIYRIVQESITNVIRHAHATYVDVILEWQDDKTVIIIEDDGVGMDLEKARESGRLGLIGMQERAEMLGGKLLVESTPQVGTTLVVEIPYANSNSYSR